MMHEDPTARRPAPLRQASNAYLMTWVAVAAFGLGYIGVAATRPELLGTILPIAEGPLDYAGNHAGNNATAAGVAEEVASLRKQVHDLQHELAATKSAMQEQAAQADTITQRLAAAEERLPPFREVKGEPVAGVGKAGMQRQQPRAQAPAQPATDAARTAQVAAASSPAEPVAAGAPNVKVLNAAPIATGSLPDTTLAQPTPAFGPAKVTAAPQPAGPRAIEIGSADSLEGLRTKWGELSGRNADVLGATAPRYRLSTDGREAPFTLLAGPYETSAQATRACNALRAKGVTCRVGAFAGNVF